MTGQRETGGGGKGRTLCLVLLLHLLLPRDRFLVACDREDSQMAGLGALRVFIDALHHNSSGSVEDSGG